MDVVTMPDLRELAATKEKWCVSVYMPTYPRADGEQDELRLKNLTEAAERELVERGMRSVDARKCVAPLLDLPRHPEWERRKTGLAVFRSNEKLVCYWLGTPFDEASIVGPRFYIRPLISALGVNPRFIILAISRNQVRVLKCTWDGSERLSLPGLPTNIEEALNLQTADRGEQVHSGMRGDLGKEAGVFHGQGGHRDTIKEESSEYFRLVDETLRPFLRQTPWPVILAGVDYEVAIYRAVSENAHIAEEFLHGGFDHVADQQLYEQAMPIARRICAAVRQQAISRYHTLLDRNRTSEDTEEIISAAHEGKIDSLFVDISAELYGRYDPERNTIETSSKRDPMYDVIELTISQTLQHGGAAYPATSDGMPAGLPMCAIFAIDAGTRCVMTTPSATAGPGAAAISSRMILGSQPSGGCRPMLELQLSGAQPFTSILCVFDSSVFGNLMVRTPSLYSAATSLSMTAQGKVTDRENLP